MLMVMLHIMYSCFVLSSCYLGSMTLNGYEVEDGWGMMNCSILCFFNYLLTTLLFTLVGLKKQCLCCYIRQKSANYLLRWVEVHTLLAHWLYFKRLKISFLFFYLLGWKWHGWSWKLVSATILFLFHFCILLIYDNHSIMMTHYL